MMERYRADTDGHLSAFDWMRGGAAIMVLLTHVRGGYFVPWGELNAASQTPLNFALFVFTRLGHEAVILFFVLSGYLVGGQALKQSMEGSFSTGRYFSARAARMYVVLIPALFLTLIVDAFGSGPSSTIQSFVVNLLFLQGFAGPSLGSNSALWSLAFEGWFYVVFGLALVAINSVDRDKQLLFGSLSFALVVCLGVANRDFLFFLPMWLLGVTIRFLPQWGGPKWRLVVWAFFGLATVVSTKLWSGLGFYLFALGAGALVHSFQVPTGPAGRWARAGHWVAAFSFSLYAIHNPLALAVHRAMPARLVTAGPIEWFGVLVISLVLCAVSFAFYWAFERHTQAVRRVIERRFYALRRV